MKASAAGPLRRALGPLERASTRLALRACILIATCIAPALCHAEGAIYVFPFSDPPVLVPVINAWNSEEADLLARSRCQPRQVNGQQCQLATTLKNQCAAIAFFPQGFVTGLGETQSAAQNSVITHCKAEGKSCTKPDTFCDSTKMTYFMKAADEINRVEAFVDQTLAQEQFGAPPVFKVTIVAIALCLLFWVLGQSFELRKQARVMLTLQEQIHNLSSAPAAQAAPSPVFATFSTVTAPPSPKPPPPVHAPPPQPQSARPTSPSPKAAPQENVRVTPHPETVSGAPRAPTRITRPADLWALFGDAWDQRLIRFGAVGLVFAALWWLIFFSIVTRHVPEPLSSFIPCFFVSTGGCGFVTFIARTAGYPAYDTWAFWISAIVIVSGYAVRHLPAKNG